MKNVSTKKFYADRCRPFLVKKYKELDFIHGFKTMKECSYFLLNGYPTKELARERMAFIFSSPGGSHGTRLDEVAC